MKFTYTYRSSDGQRHTAEIEAENRDAAFAKVRAELGIKPIKVTAAGGDGRDRQTSRDKRRVSPSTVLAVLAALTLVAGGSWWWAVRRSGASYRVMTPQGPVTYSEAIPLVRQMIPGDRRRIEEAMGTSAGESARLAAFANPADRFLSRFAEPGRPAEQEDGRPSDADFEAALREPVRVASTDFTEAVDLKRIVAGMKREMRAYLAGGGTVAQYLAELAKRQKLEIAYRENAERRLAEMLQKPQDAYAYWLKANAQLQAMGIWPLPLPDVLRSYQMNLDIDE